MRARARWPRKERARSLIPHSPPFENTVPQKNRNNRISRRRSRRRECARDFLFVNAREWRVLVRVAHRAPRLFVSPRTGALFVASSHKSCGPLFGATSGVGVGARGVSDPQQMGNHFSLARCAEQSLFAGRELPWGRRADRGAARRRRAPGTRWAPTWRSWPGGSRCRGRERWGPPSRRRSPASTPSGSGRAVRRRSACGTGQTGGATGAVALRRHPPWPPPTAGRPPGVAGRGGERASRSAAPNRDGPRLPADGSRPPCDRRRPTTNPLPLACHCPPRDGDPWNAVSYRSTDGSAFGGGALRAKPCRLETDDDAHATESGCVSCVGINSISSVVRPPRRMRRPFSPAGDAHPDASVFHSPSGTGFSSRPPCTG